MLTQPSPTQILKPPARGCDLHFFGGKIENIGIIGGVKHFTNFLSAIPNPFLSPVEITVVVRNAESNEDIADALVGFEIGNLAWQKLTDEFGEATFTMG